MQLRCCCICTKRSRLAKSHACQRAAISRVERTFEQVVGTLVAVHIGGTVGPLDAHSNQVAALSAAVRQGQGRQVHGPAGGLPQAGELASGLAGRRAAVLHRAAASVVVGKLLGVILSGLLTWLFLEQGCPQGPFRPSRFARRPRGVGSPRQHRQGSPAGAGRRVRQAGRSGGQAGTSGTQVAQAAGSARLAVES